MTEDGCNKEFIAVQFDPECDQEYFDKHLTLLEIKLCHIGTTSYSTHY